MYVFYIRIVLICYSSHFRGVSMIFLEEGL